MAFLTIAAGSEGNAVKPPARPRMKESAEDE
jgi:hypothetical protein